MFLRRDDFTTDILEGLGKDNSRILNSKMILTNLYFSYILAMDFRHMVMVAEW